MIVDRNRQNSLGLLLSNHILIHLFHDGTRRRDLVEQLVCRSPTSLFLVQDRLAQLNTFVADVDIARPFNKWPNVTVTLAAKRTKSVLLGRATTTIPTLVFSRGHSNSFRTTDLDTSKQSRSVASYSKVSLEIDRKAIKWIDAKAPWGILVRDGRAVIFTS
jgi:hypothetical protein